MNEEGDAPRPGGSDDGGAVDVEVPGALDGMRLDRAICLISGASRADAARLIDSGEVSVAAQVATSRSRRVAAGEHLAFGPIPRIADEEPVADAGVPFAVVWCDEHVIVVDKPAGVVVHPGAGVATGTLVNGLLARFEDLGRRASEGGMGPLQRPGIVHRLDKGTSGLLVVARDPVAFQALGEAVRGRRVDRDYLALVDGAVGTAAGLIDAPIARSARDATRMAVSAAGRPSRTRYEVLRTWSAPQTGWEAVTELEAHLETGRTHQIRVHLAAIGHPIVGDDRYGRLRRPPGARGVRSLLGRPFLHAHRLGFDHPVTGVPLSFTSALPEDLVRVVDALGAPDGAT